MDKKDILNKFIKSENLDGKKLTKVSIYFQRIWEKETMPGTFFFEDGTSKEGYSYNNNALNGSIEFSNNEDSIPINDFIQGLKDGDWEHVEESIGNFDGQGKSIDHDEDEFESFEEGDSEGCEFDTKIDPSEISLYFGDEEIQFNLIDDSLYEFKNTKYSKEDIIQLANNFNK